MTQITVDEDVARALHGIPGPAQLCDRNGRVLGLFTPTFDPTLYEGLEPQISEEELQRREAQLGGRSLRAILADLEKRP